MPHRPNNLINTKNCYRTVDVSMRRGKKNLIKKRYYIGEKKQGEKRKREADRERNLWEEKRSKGVIMRE